MDLREGRDRVWDMWTTPPGLTSWLCERAKVEPFAGGAYELYWNPDQSQPLSNSTNGCRVLSIDRPRLLVVSWRGSDAVARVMDAPGAPTTQVEVRLFPTLDGTRLELRHMGWGRGPEWTRARQWFELAWSNAFERLRMRLSAAWR
jgi:uncharacterized protein YndB with AHSA1/START domain